MQAEILMIGTELLIGQIQDTNAAFMGRLLAEHGINLYQKTTVGDNRGRILAALDGALRRSDVVLCSGGLGPTEDDITRDCVAELLGRPLEYDEALFEAILARFAHARRQITENNKRQAWLPRGTEAIENPNGTAPGLLADDARGVVICMPGVPSELKPMLEERVIPWLRQRFGMGGVLHYRVLKACGIGESRVDSMIGDLITSGANPTVGLLASPEAVRIRIAARAETREAAEALIDPVEQEIHVRMPGMIMGCDNDTLESVVDRLLSEKGWRLAVAETETGGMLMQRLTAAESAAFAGGRVLPAADASSDEEEQIAFLQEIMLYCRSHCGIGLFAEPQRRLTRAVFITPSGCHDWEIGHYGRIERNQMRSCIAALERIRRLLTGSPGEG
jgi:nicotinamide-nucleotide amidase